MILGCIMGRHDWLPNNMGCIMGRHDWLLNKNGMRMCAKCGKIDGYFSVSGMGREANEIETEKEGYLAELSGGAKE